MSLTFIDNRQETMIEQVKRLTRENQALSDEIELLNTRIETMCEGCVWPKEADKVSMRLRKERAEANRDYNTLLAEYQNYKAGNIL